MEFYIRFMLITIRVCIDCVTYNSLHVTIANGLTESSIVIDEAIL